MLRGWALESVIRPNASPPLSVAGGSGRAERQWGVVSRAQLLGARASRAAAPRHWRRGGPAARRATAASTRSATALRAEGRRLAAVLACGPGAVLSHRSAAAHWGLLRPTRRASTSPPRAAATAPRGSACTALVPSMPRTPPATRASRSRRSAARCSTSPRTRHERAARAGARAGRAPAALRPPRDHRRHRAVQRAPRNGKPRQSDRHRAKVTRSEWEDRMLGLVRGAGLPVPSATSRSTPPITATASPTTTGPDTSLIVETDGWDSHSTRAAFETTAPRTPR